MYIKRAIEETIKSLNDTFPIVLVTGPRQVGKTTILEHIKEENRKYVTLDDPTMRYLAKNDPVTFIQNFKPPIIIDEIQYAPELLSYIKSNKGTVPLFDTKFINTLYSSYLYSLLEKEEKQAVAIKALENGADIEFVSKITGLKK